MRVVQATFGTFHHFDLATELLKRGHLLRIYSTFPWRRLKREGIPREYVGTFPSLHTVQILAGKYIPEWMTSTLDSSISTTFDSWLSKRVPECDALIALSPSALETAKIVQQRGGMVFCDRGSTHRAFQRRILEQEYAHWGIPWDRREERQVQRELQVYEQSDAIVVPSQVVRQTFVNEGVPPAKVHVIPYGVRVDRFNKVADPPRDRFEVLFVGGVSLRKGIPYLLRAFERVVHPHKRLRVVGAMSPEMEKLLPQLPRENVEFLGSLPQGQLAEIFSASHVLVLPSVEEGLALVQGQAMACGCPVIATAATGAEDLFQDGREGFIVPDTGIGKIAERMQQLADDPDLQQRMSEAALRRVHALGGWSAYGDLWVELLKRSIKC